MIKMCRTLAVAAAVSAAVLSGAGNAQAQTCNPGLGAGFARHPAAYTALLTGLLPQVGNFTTKLRAVVDQPTYASLLTDARTLANSMANGRVLITVPDGTTVIDTARSDDAACDITVAACSAWGGFPEDVPAGCPCANGQRNSYGHFQKKSVNENHNSRIAVLDTQEWPCGLGLETKFSTSTGQNEHYVGFRLGAHLDAEGTARFSVRQ